MSNAWIVLLEAAVDSPVDVGDVERLLVGLTDCYPSALHAVHRLHVGGAHVRELDEPLGAGVHVRAAVEHQHRAAGDGKPDRDGRPVHASHPLQVEEPCRERGTRRPGRGGSARSPQK